MFSNITGTQGGLAFLLMDEDGTEKLPMPITFPQMHLAREYFDALRSYVTKAEAFARECNFIPIVATKTEQTRWNLTTTSAGGPDIYSLSIGGISIESLDMMEQFYKMVKGTQHHKVDAEFQQVQAAAERLKGAFGLVSNRNQ